MHRVLSVDSDIALVDAVDEVVGQQLALKRVAQRVVDVVVAGLYPQYGLGRQVEQRAIDGARCAAAGVNTSLVLMELIAGVGGRDGSGNLRGREPFVVVEE